MFKTILMMQNPHWEGLPYASLFTRVQFSGLVKKLTLREIQVLIGIRRSGKSTLFKLLINHLLNSEDGKSILYLNLDDPFFSEVWKDPTLLYKVIETAEQMTEIPVQYLFLDEVQNISGWERFVKSTYDAHRFKKIFVTGSNSSLLQGDYATRLSGRYIVEVVMPLDFREVLATHNIQTSLDRVKHKTKIFKLFENFLMYGGFPEVLKTQDVLLKREQLLSYYDTLLVKDCISNNAIREIKKFKELALYLLSNAATLYSYNGLAKVVGSNENTVKEFVRILEESFILKEIRNFSHSLKNQTKSKKKIYCLDNGLMNAVSFRMSENRGKFLENLVFTELLKWRNSEVYFFHDQRECDFIVRKEGQLIALQVTIELTSANREREILGLNAALDKFSIPKGYILTRDAEYKKLDHRVEIMSCIEFFVNKA